MKGKRGAEGGQYLGVEEGVARREKEQDEGQEKNEEGQKNGEKVEQAEGQKEELEEGRGGA